MDKQLKFNSRGEFTILQISDVQDLHYMRRAQDELLRLACERVRPDLVVFTGDNILGNHICDAHLGTKKYDLTHDEEYDIIMRALYKVFRWPQKMGIPFAVIFGNHDDMNKVTKDEQGDMIRAYAMNRGFENTGDLAGTYCLPVMSSDGSEKRLLLYMIDTATYNKEEKRSHEEITRAEADWFREQTAADKAKNGGKATDSIVFLHIPLKESQYFIEECPPEEADAVEKGVGIRLRREETGVTGSLGEPVDPVADEYGFYDAVLDNGGVRAIISGHNHVNNYEGVRDGIRFIATPGASFRCYGNVERGVRVLRLREDDPGDFDTYVLKYYDLAGDTPITRFKYFWDADETEKIKWTAIGGAALAGAAAFAVAATGAGGALLKPAVRLLLRRR